MRLLVIAILAVVAAAAGPVRAADTEQPSKIKYVQPFDTDKNGVTTDAEMKAGIKARFEALDTDKNGKLTNEEFAEGQMKWRALMDTKIDGIVEVGEFTEFFCGPEPKKGDKTKHPAANKHYNECVAYRRSLYEVKDADKNGKFSEAEHQADNAAIFKQMDKNGDNFLEPGEFYAADLETKAPGKKKASAKPAGPRTNTIKTEPKAPVK